MNILNSKQKGIVVIIGIFVIGIIIYYISTLSSKYDYEDTEFLQENEVINKINEPIEEITNEIVIHIAGEVQQQGIVVVNEGARIQDIIDIAGGLTTQADLTQVNLAYKVQDGQKIIIPSKTEEPQEEKEYITKENGNNIIQGDIPNKEEEKMVNINTATQEELMQLQGIGEATAKKIIDYRQENGKFNSIEDLKNVSGIGEAKFNSISDKIIV